MKAVSALWIAASLFLNLGDPTSPWEPIKLPEEATGKSLYGVTFVGKQAGWIVGEKGLCLQSADGGRTWKGRDLGTSATLRSVRFMDTKVGVIVGDGDPDAPKPTGHIVMGRPMGSGTVLWTLDGGITWLKGHLPTNFEIHCAQTSGGPLQFGISGGDFHLDGDVLRTAADLKAWDGKSVKSARCYRALFDIAIVQDRRWVAVGSPVSVGFVPPPTDVLYTNGKCRALFSQDGGETWVPSNGSEGSGCLRGLAVRNHGAQVLTVGDGGGILLSGDKGASWKPVKSDCDQDLFAVAGSEGNPDLVVAVGDKETTLISRDGGNSWKRISWGESAFQSIAVAGDTWIVVGEKGIARRAGLKALSEAKAVTPPAPAKPAPKGPTQTQLERLGVGDRAIYEIEINAPAMNIHSSFQKQEKIAAVTPMGFTVEVEVLKGDPPMGQPRKGSQELAFADLTDYSAWKVGEAKEDKDKTGTMTRTRLADRQVKAGEKTWECIVVQMKIETVGGGQSVLSETCFAKSSEIPGLGLVQEETVQEVAAPQGKIRITQTTKLVSFARVKK